MRTPLAGQRLRLAASVALAVPAVALTTALGATTASAEPGDPTPTPTPTATQPPAEPAKPAPDKPSVAKPAGENVDVAVKLDAPKTFTPGKTSRIKITVTASAVVEYRGIVQIPSRLKVVNVESPGWKVADPEPAGDAGKNQRLRFASTGEAPSAEPSPIELEVEPLEGVAVKGAINVIANPVKATDPDTANNTAAQRAIIEGAGTVKGRAWHDKNRNGVQDDGEPGAAGVYVAIGDPQAEDPLNDTFTEADGRYEFKALPLDDYLLIAVTRKDTWAFTKPNAGEESKDSDVVVEVKLPETTKKLRRDALLKARKSLGANAGAAEEEQFIVAGVYPVKVDGTADVVLDAGLVSLGGTPSPTPSTTPTATPAPGGGSLPVTGGALTGIIGAGVLLLSGGAGLTLLARRRRANATFGE